MKPVFQTIFDKNHGNCFSAGLASILEVPLETVPNFMHDFGEDWHKEINRWLDKHFGMMWLRVLMDEDERLEFHPLPEGSFCLATGKSPRGNWYHTVVGTITGGFNFRMLHDPHPDRTGIVGNPVCIEFLVPKNPAKGVFYA